MFSMSEQSTGFAIISCEPNRKTAINLGMERILTAGEKVFCKAVRNTLKEYGKP